jgi:hypothetical protein
MLDTPSTPRQQVDAEHLKLLSIFHYVVAGMTGFFASIPIIHLVIGLLFIFAPQVFGPERNQPPVFIGWLIAVLAAGFILIGWSLAVLLALAGRFLGRRMHYNFCFVMACVECVFVPIGTVLGVFTLLVLVRASAKELFTPRPKPIL